MFLKACFTSILVSRVPIPFLRTSATMSFTVIYDSDASSLHTPSFTLCPAGADRSIIRRNLWVPILGSHPKGTAMDP